MCAVQRDAAEQRLQLLPALPSSWKMSSSTEDIEKPSVAEILKERSLFVTGVTGFVGKVLLEKLLRCCQDIKKIYVLVRVADTEDCNRRIRKLFEERVFEEIRSKHPHMFEKVVPLEGDLGYKHCNIKETEIDMMEPVSVVLHCAADVRFDESFRRAMAVNVEGVKNVLDVCRRLPNLEALVHVSTAYAFCNQRIIAEDLYSELATPEELMNVCKWMDDDELEMLFKSLRTGRPSTYHFSKAIAEHLVQIECERSLEPKGCINERKPINACIVRPSIVTAAWKEPFPGWVDTNNGPSGLIAACGKGIVRSVHAPSNIIADFVPVDVVVNTILVAARNLIDSRSRGDKDNKFIILNCTTNETNPLTWGDIQKICLPLLFKYPSMSLYRYPGGSFKNSSAAHRWSMITDHMIPAYFVQVVSYITRRPYRVINVYHRINNVLNHLKFFTTQQFDFRCDKYLSLMNEMGRMDSEVFYIDTRPLNWSEYFQNYVSGVRKFLLKENEETIPQAIKRMNRIYYICLAFKVSVFCCSALAIYSQTQHISKVVFKIMSVLAETNASLMERAGKFLKLQ